MERDSHSTELNPFGIALDGVVELGRFVDMSWAGLGYAKVAPRVVKLKLRAKEVGLDRDAVPPVHPGDMERAQQLEAFANEQSATGFSYLYALAAVRLWTILETYVQDVVLKTIIEVQSARNLPVIRKLKGPLMEFSEAPHYQQAELILRLLIDELEIAFKKGIGRFEEILAAVDLGGPVDDEVRKVLYELSEVRNVTVHRNGIVDARFARNCPWFAVTIGQALRVSHLNHDRYIAAVHWYILEVEKRRRAKYDSSSDPLESTLATEMMELQSGLAGKRRGTGDSHD